jgi:putative tricarboxylic transport membrane protein
MEVKVESPAVTERPGTRWNSETISGLVVLALSLCAYLMTYRFAKVPPMLSQNIPPTFFPRIILTASGFMSGILLVRGLSRREPPLPGVPGVVWMTAAVISGGAILLSKIGILPMILLTSLILPRLWGERRWLRVLLFAVLTPAAIYLLFTLILGLRLPLGILERIF